MADDPRLLPVAALCIGLLAGLGAGWLWRGVGLRRLRADHATRLERIHELEVERAGLDSAHEMLAQQNDRNSREVLSLRGEREALHAELARAQARQEALERRRQEEIDTLRSARGQLGEEFENLAHRIFEERGRQLGTHQNAALDALLKPLSQQIQQFQSRVNEVHREAVAGQAGLGEQLRQMQQVGLQMSEQADNLSRALKGDKKTTGNWGEVQLERTLQLAGLEPGQHYEAQAALRSSDGRRQVPDFLVKRPDGKHLVVDSKVSLVDFESAVVAATEDARGEALRAHVAALRRHIDSLSAKDYAGLPGLQSPSLVFMFLPIEAAFIEALRCDADLFNYGHLRNVILASPTTLLPMMRTVANLWIAYQSDTEARAISDAAGDIYNKVALLSERLEDLGRSLGTAVGKYNRTVTAVVGRQGLQGRIERFRSVSANARGDLPQPASLHPAIDSDRLSTPGDTGPEDTAV